MKKAFDCVEMKRRGQEAMREKLAAMTPQERLAYWERRYQEITERQRTARAQQKKRA